MKKENFRNIIQEVSKIDLRILTDKGEIDQMKLFDLLDKYDENILKLFLNNEKIKESFFIKIGESYIFKHNEFKFYVEEHSPLANSYTEYINRIGLASGKKYLKDSDDIVLNIPFKDCILEGGQSNDEGIESYFEFYEGTDDEITGLIGKNEHMSISDKKGTIKTITGYLPKQSKRKEIFYNEVLAKYEIDRLLDKKALINWKRYTKEGIKEVEEIRKDEDGKIKENLIIKGNNLLALHSLKEKFVDRIKLIYIDPPYNTGSDSFSYNDNFSRSTWLIFMKNRLEVARELMNKMGIIAVQCSFHNYPYLKVLMDEIFKEENYKCTFHVQVRHPDRQLTGDKEYNDVIEYTLLYSKNPNLKLPKKITEKTDDDYIYEITTIGEGEKGNLDGRDIKIFTPDKYKVEKKLGDSILFKDISIRGSIREKNSSGRFYVKNLESLKGKFPSGTLIKVSNIGDDIYDYRYFYLPRKGNKNGGYFQGKPTSSKVTESPYPNFYNFESAYNTVAEEGNVSFRNGKKPEIYLQFLIELLTEKGDYVLDYHLGSGTTTATAHKLGRNYIGIEQMNYIENITVERMNSVINGDEKGISKVINWQGGGEFIYCELAKWNENAKEMILECDSVNKLILLFDELYDKYFLNYNLKIKEFKEKIIREDNFLKLDLDDQKKMFITMLDLNQMYINKDDMDDVKFQLSKNDREITKKFYE